MMEKRIERFKKKIEKKGGDEDWKREDESKNVDEGFLDVDEIEVIGKEKKNVEKMIEVVK